MFEITDAVQKEFEKAKVKIIEPEHKYESVPEIDISLFSEEEMRLLKQPVEGITRFLLEYIIITDNFDHDQRIKWIDYMEEKFSGFNQFYNTNKLRLNTMGANQPYINAIRKIAEKKQMHELSIACDLVPPMTKRYYGVIGLDEKLDYLYKFEKALYNILENMSSNQTTDQ